MADAYPLHRPLAEDGELITVGEILHLLHEIDETTKKLDTVFTGLCRSKNVQMVAAVAAVAKLLL
jgi:hypothetical protein